ncbi:hypothetical protein TIFTF001_002723 [Ficus carica]|uniref:Uncharacterized protein n=1 Tax=Ficus carica TaxID=3494 RepID=A0AA88CQ04_FICCA|nr:hypothetical protein TIFTF001_002723 [Ficus carica]
MYVENGLTCDPCQACGNRDGGGGVGAIAVICCPLAWSPNNKHQANQSYRRLEVAWRKGGESPANQRGQRVVGI